MNKKEMREALECSLRVEQIPLRAILLSILDALPEPKSEAQDRIEAIENFVKTVGGPEPVEVKESQPTSAGIPPDEARGYMDKALSQADRCALQNEEIIALLAHIRADLGQRPDPPATGGVPATPESAAEKLWEGELLIKGREIYEYTEDTVAKHLSKDPAWRRIKVKEVR